MVGSVKLEAVQLDDKLELPEQGKYMVQNCEEECSSVDNRFHTSCGFERAKQQ